MNTEENTNETVVEETNQETPEVLFTAPAEPVSASNGTTETTDLGISVEEFGAKNNLSKADATTVLRGLKLLGFVEQNQKPKLPGERGRSKNLYKLAGKSRTDHLIFLAPFFE